MLAAVIRTGGSSRDFFGTAYGQNGDKYDGFEFGDGNVSVNETLLLIEPEAAKKYAIELKKLIEAKPPEGDAKSGTTKTTGPGPQPADVGKTGKSGSGTVAVPKPKSFRGTVEVPAETANARLVTIADGIIKLLASDPNATIRVTPEIAAEYPQGASDTIRRGVSENAGQLGFKPVTRSTPPRRGGVPGRSDSRPGRARVPPRRRTSRRQRGIGHANGYGSPTISPHALI